MLIQAGAVNLTSLNNAQTACLESGSFVGETSFIGGGLERFTGMRLFSVTDARVQYALLRVALRPSSGVRCNDVQNKWFSRSCLLDISIAALRQCFAMLCAARAKGSVRVFSWPNEQLSEALSGDPELQVRVEQGSPGQKGQLKLIYH